MTLTMHTNPREEFVEASALAHAQLLLRRPIG